jgi:hypothetical protein
VAQVNASLGIAQQSEVTSWRASPRAQPSMDEAHDGRPTGMRPWWISSRR